jgi:hypothetical protein
VKATGQRQFREEAAQLKAGQEQLRAERDQAQAQLAAVQQEKAALAKRIGEMQVAAVESLQAPAPAKEAKGKRR